MKTKALHSTLPIVIPGALLLMGIVLPRAAALEVDLTPFHDSETPLKNPHKGWYHHYPDNSPKKYRIRKDADLLELPGMDHLYIRLAWSYLEPAQGEFQWDVIDRLIEKWTGHGLGIAFRISCRETSTDPVEQQFATPRWVMEAGAKGDYYYKGEKTGPTGPWEPVFDDPVFLAKLESFLRVFAERYDGRPWLRYIDIGSIGDWGEGHTSSGSRLRYGYEQRKPHVDLHLKYFKKTQIVVSDDFVYGIQDPDERKRMHRYIVDNGITYRDDSILVDWYVKQYPDTFCVRSPQFFADAWRQGPNVLELQHYGSVLEDGNWTPDPGSSLARHGGGKTGPDIFRGALRQLRATYIGYHGFAHEWLADNPELTGELLNRCGYWYFPHAAEIPGRWERGKEAKIVIRWENRGVAPAYHAFDLVIRFAGTRTAEVTVPSGNRRWLPEPEGGLYSQSYAIRVPENLPPGSYALKMKLRSEAAGRDVGLPLDRELLDDDGFYQLAEVRVGG